MPSANAPWPESSNASSAVGVAKTSREKCRARDAAANTAAERRDRRRAREEEEEGSSPASSKHPPRHAPTYHTSARTGVASPRVPVRSSRVAAARRSSRSTPDATASLATARGSGGSRRVLARRRVRRRASRDGRSRRGVAHGAADRAQDERGGGSERNLVVEARRVFVRRVELAARGSAREEGRFARAPPRVDARAGRARGGAVDAAGEALDARQREPRGVAHAGSAGRPPSAVLVRLARVQPLERRHRALGRRVARVADDGRAGTGVLRVIARCRPRVEGQAQEVLRDPARGIAGGGPATARRHDAAPRASGAKRARGRGAFVAPAATRAGVMVVLSSQMTRVININFYEMNVFGA